MKPSRPFLAITLLMGLLASQSLSAISPAFVLVYGDGFAKPVVVNLTVQNVFANQLLWGGVKRFIPPAERQIPSGLEGRRYYKLAIYWGLYDMETAKPEDASQHARLYLPTASEPAVIVATPPHMKDEPRPIPSELQGFFAGWTLTADELAIVKRLGVPGLQP